ncbi:MAG: hypothetical protein J6X88_03710 [Bacteroidales bacterium]|nr:hypothetical protein [Bacteroidales bacterium]
MKKQIFTHAGIIIALFALACAYLSPVLSGKAIKQSDIQKADAMAYQQRMEKQRTGTIPNWAEGMFSGMPGYQITGEPQTSVFQPLRDIAIMRHIGLERNIGVLFLYLLGFYVAMLAFGVSPWLALIGALGFGLGSYNIIIIEAGHITKAWAMSMMAPVVSGMVLTLRSAIDDTLEKRKRTQRVLWGSLLFTLSLILQISFNHIQITFYTAIACVFIGIAYLVYAIVRKRFVPFLLMVALLVVGAGLAFGCNARLLLVNEEYARYTMRGGNELTITASDMYGDQEPAEQNTSTGLDIDYAFSWSNGIGETYTLLVPGAMGGGSGEMVGKKSAFFKNFRTEQAPLYWGDQPFTSGPVYFGAILIMLFVVGMILVKGPERWWLLAATLLAIVLSWGKNWMGLNEWVFNNVPLYNKFRTPSMALVLANVCVAIMAVLALREVFSKDRDQKRVNRALYIGAGALTVFILGVLLLSSGFSYSGASDRQMEAQYGNQWSIIFSALAEDRAHLLKSDSWRSIIFILLAGGVLWFYNNEKLKKNAVAIGAVALLVLIDLWGVDRRYLNKNNFCDKRQLELRPDKYDYDIDEQAARYGDHDFRVFNMAVNTFNDSKPAAFHDQVGGYSAAKLSRYQNMIDFYLSRHINPKVLDMLNTRYVVQSSGGQAIVMRNPEALGNAWFVEEVKPVGSANEEITVLGQIDPAHTAVVDTALFAIDALTFAPDSGASIELVVEKNPSADLKKYTATCSSDRLAVFSEVYYKPDWFAYIDGEPAEYLRANYILRAMVIPAGTHEIVFRNEAPWLHKLDRVTLAISIATLLLMAGAVVLVYRRKKEMA